MARAEKTKSKRVTVLNWMGTLLLYAIPGVNLVALILFIIFAKTTSKRNFAIAGLLLILIAAILTCAAFLIFPVQMSRLAAELRGGDAVTALITPQG